MKWPSSSVCLLVSVFCVLIAVQTTCGLPTGASNESSEFPVKGESGESAIVQFIGTQEEVANHTLAEEDHHEHRHGVKGFFQKLGCDLVRGTEIVAKSVSEGKVWTGVKKGFAKVKSFFSKSDKKDNEDAAESKEGVQEVASETPTTNTMTTTTTTETLPPALINEIESADADPEIDVRILG